MARPVPRHCQPAVVFVKKGVEYHFGTHDYDAYMASTTYKSKRARAWLRACGRCVVCHIRKATNTHHSTYARFGREDLDDLLPVCRECHLRIHGLVPVPANDNDQPDLFEKTG